MSKINTVLDLDSILDGNLNAVKDVPDYVNPPTGAYTISIPKAEFTVKKDKKGEQIGRFVITYQVDSTLELADEEALPVADGSLFNETFTYTEQGLEFFKKQAKKILNVDSLDDVSLREILDSLKDVAPFQAKLSTAENSDGFTNTRINPIHSQE